MVRFLTKVTFVVGFFIGVFLAIIVLKSNETTKTSRRLRPFISSNYNEWLAKSQFTRQKIAFDTLRYSNKSFLLESEFLFKKINVLCLILVRSRNNLQAAQATWAKGCNEIQTVDLGTDKKKLVVKRNKEDSSWVLLCKALQKIPENKFTWILVVYDYTFVIMENLRFFLASLDPQEQYYLGHAVKFWGIVYNMGQAGYVLSRGTLKEFKKKWGGTEVCDGMIAYMNREDYYLGKHLTAVNITPADTRDSNGFSLFHPYNLYQVFFPSESHYKFSIYPQQCCSPHTIAFQSIEADKMYTYYYLLYTLQLFKTGNLGNKPSIAHLSDDKVWKDFLKARDVPVNVTAARYYQMWIDLIDDPNSFAKHMKREEYDDYSLH